MTAEGSPTPVPHPQPRTHGTGPLQVSARLVGRVLVVTAVGALDVATYRTLRTATLAQLTDVASPNPHLVLDVAGVAFLDSSGLGAIVHLFKRVRARGGAFGLAGANTRVTELLRITGLHTIIPSAGTVEDAVTGILRNHPGSP